MDGKWKGRQAVQTRMPLCPAALRPRLPQVHYGQLRGGASSRYGLGLVWSGRVGSSLALKPP
jgi:hypothetical protein